MVKKIVFLTSVDKTLNPYAKKKIKGLGICLTAHTKWSRDLNIDLMSQESQRLQA